MTDNHDLKPAILRCLRHGKAQAITGRQLAGLLGQRNDRGIRLAIRELIAEGVPVASTTEKPGGFFIATTISEVENYAQGLRGRLVEDAIRRRDFLRASKAITQPQQLELPMGVI